MNPSDDPKKSIEDLIAANGGVLPITNWGYVPPTYVHGSWPFADRRPPGIHVLDGGTSDFRRGVQILTRSHWPAGRRRYRIRISSARWR